MLHNGERPVLDLILKDIVKLKVAKLLDN